MVDDFLVGCMLMNSRSGPPFGGCMLMNSRGGPPHFERGSASKDNFYGSSGSFLYLVNIFGPVVGSSVFYRKKFTRMQEFRC